MRNAARHVCFVALLASGAWQAAPAWASHARVSWQPVSGAAGYKLYVRSAGQPYDQGIDVGAVAAGPDGVIRYVTSGPPLNVQFYFAVTRYNSAKVESALSNEVALTIVSPPLGTQAPEQVSDGGNSSSSSAGPPPTDTASSSGPVGPTQPNTASGDVVPCASGNETVVGDDANRRHASLVRVFSGGEPPRLLLQFRAFRSTLAAPGPLAVAVGTVLPDTGGTGQIVVSDRMGWLYVYSIEPRSTTSPRCIVRAILRRRFPAFPDDSGAVVSALAVGDALPDHPGDEIVVAAGGTTQAGLVRILDGDSGAPLLEFEAFEAAPAPTATISLWVGDVIATLPGAEIIVGQGGAGTPLRVFNVADGVPIHVLDATDLQSAARSVWLDPSGM